MTVASVTEAVKEASVTMGTGCEGVPPATAGTGKPVKPDDPVGVSAFLQSEGASCHPPGLSTGFCGGGNERSKCKIVHDRVLRIRKEHHRLVEHNVREGLRAREKVAFVQVGKRMGVLLYARPILPSPLGTKAPIN